MGVHERSFISSSENSVQYRYSSDVYVLEMGSGIFVIEKNRSDKKYGQFISISDVVQLLNTKDLKVSVQLNSKSHINNYI